MPNITPENLESLPPADVPQRAGGDLGHLRDEEYENDADETSTEEDSNYDGTDSDAGDSMSGDILQDFADWKAQLKREATAERDLESPCELNSANLVRLTRALHPDSSTEDHGYESEDESEEEDLDENGRPIARLTKGYKRSNVTDSDDGYKPDEDEPARLKAHNSHGSTISSSIPSTPPHDNQETTAGASAPSTPSSDGVKRLSAYGWTPRRESSLEDFPPFDFDYIPYSRPTDIVVSRHTDRAPSRGRRSTTASFGPSVQQNHLKRAGFVPVPYDVAVARAVEIARMDDPGSAPDSSKHPLYAKQTLEIPPRVPPFYNATAWSRPPIAYRVFELLDSDLKDCCLDAPTCNDCNTKICDDCGSTCAPDPCWCVVGGCTRCPVTGGNICRYHVDKWEAKGRPDTFRGHPVSKDSFKRR